MSYTEEDYRKLSEDVYSGDLYGWRLNDKPVVSSTSGTSYEKNDLQASLVNDNGQYTIVFRGTSSGADWVEDAGLNNPHGYLDTKSQFRDADAWIQELQKTPTSQGGLQGVDMSQVNFTGHSLGGALAQYEAVKHSSKAVTFSAPSAYNMLTPEERKRISQADILNLRRADDIIPDMPPGVPRLGTEKFVEGGINWLWALGGAGGHEIGGFYVDSNGQLVRGNQFSKSAINFIYRKKHPVQ